MTAAAVNKPSRVVPLKSAAALTVATGGKPEPARGPLALPPIRDGKWLRTAPNQLPQELIGGMLHRGCKMVLAAGSKARKTWTLIDMGLSVATGTPWMGLPTAAGPVLFVNFEVQEAFFVERLRQVAKARGLEIPGTFHGWNLRGHSTSSATLLPRLAKEMQSLKPALVILDPTYKLMGGTPENDAAAVTLLCNDIERLAVDTGAAVAFAAHFSKGNQAAKDAMDRISGSGVFARDPDAIVLMTKHTEDQCLTIETVLRNCPEIPAFVVEWQFPLLVRREDLDPSDLKQINEPGGKKPGITLEELISLLEIGEAIRTADWQKRAQETVGIGRSRFWEIITGMRTKGGSPKLKDHGKDGFTRLL